MEQRWKFGPAPPLGSEWENTCSPHRADDDPAPRTFEVAKTDWVRLIPLYGPDSALLSSSVQRDELGRPAVAGLAIDRKLVEEGDLLTCDLAVGYYASERLARALAEIEPTGIHIESIPHCAPNRVAGRRLFRLDVSGSTGPFCDTRFRLGHKDWTTFDPAFPKAIPVRPVCFDASEASGDSVMLSPWLGSGDPEWQALILSGDVYLNLVAKLGPLLCGSERVAYRGAWVRGEGRPATLEDDESNEPYEPPPVSATLDAIRAGIERYKHVLGERPTDAALAKMTTLAGFDLDNDYVCVIRALGGACLFDGALYFLSPDPEVGQWVTLGQDEYLRMPFEEGCIPIGHMRNKGYWWMLDRNGRVRAWGEDGSINGPDVDFASWLDGQVKDLAYALDHEDELTWASVVLDR
jgi:hypothetical protein